MRYEQLSRHDQELLNTDLGDFDKEASAMVKMASEGYEMGFEKIALEIADSLEIQAIEENMDKTASGDELDPESEKTAAEMGAFIERGVFEGLQKLGQERYGNPDIYLEALAIEKLADAAAAETKAEVKESLTKRMKDKLTEAWAATTGAAKATGSWIKNPYYGKGGIRALADMEEAKKLWGTEKMKAVGQALKGAAKYTPHAAVVGGIGTYGYKKLKGKKDEQRQ